MLCICDRDDLHLSPAFKYTAWRQMTWIGIGNISRKLLFSSPSKLEAPCLDFRP